MENMFADQLDTANYYAEQATEKAIAQQRLRAAPQQIQNADGSWPHPECDTCGDDIEPERLAHGMIRCFSCQDAKERKEKRR